MSLIIFDWDDTLYPTTWSLQNNTNKSNFKKLDDVLYDLLNKCLKIASVVIITNAEREWVYNKLEDLPNTFNLFKHIPVISARKYNTFVPTESELYEWKKEAFMRVVTSENFYNVISIGDSVYEYEALISIYDYYGNRMLLKPISTLKWLNCEQLIYELKLINNGIIEIVREKRNLDKIIII